MQAIIVDQKTAVNKNLGSIVALYEDMPCVRGGDVDKAGQRHAKAGGETKLLLHKRIGKIAKIDVCAQES